MSEEHTQFFMTNNAIDTFSCKRLRLASKLYRLTNEYCLATSWSFQIQQYLQASCRDNAAMHLIIYNESVHVAAPNSTKTNIKQQRLERRCKFASILLTKQKTTKHVARKRGYIVAQDTSGKVKIMFGIA